MNALTLVSTELEGTHDDTSQSSGGDARKTIGWFIIFFLVTLAWVQSGQSAWARGRPRIWQTSLKRCLLQLSIFQPNKSSQSPADKPLQRERPHHLTTFLRISLKALVAKVARPLKARAALLPWGQVSLLIRMAPSSPIIM